MASGFSLLLLFRLDAIVLMPGFEWLDYGESYMHVFIHACMHVYTLGTSLNCATT